MNPDIGPILDDWAHEPGKLTVRRIVGRDGKEKIQLRLDLGILQMETSGRPDGQRPHGHESLLDHYQHEQTRVRSAGEGPFRLDESACEELRNEGLMYYHRYLAAFVLEDFQSVEQDTRRNLRLFDFVRDNAAEESDRVALEQYRPYVLMMHTQARAHLLLQDGRGRSALQAVREGIRQIESFYEAWEEEVEEAEESGELSALRGLAEEIQQRLPADPLDQLRQNLSEALQDERYEDAATIRDRIRAYQRRRSTSRRSR